MDNSALIFKELQQKAEEKKRQKKSFLQQKLEEKKRQKEEMETKLQLSQQSSSPTKFFAQVPELAFQAHNASTIHSKTFRTEIPATTPSAVVPTTTASTVAASTTPEQTNSTLLASSISTATTPTSQTASSATTPIDNVSTANSPAKSTASLAGLTPRGEDIADIDQFVDSLLTEQGIHIFKKEASKDMSSLPSLVPKKIESSEKEAQTDYEIKIDTQDDEKPKKKRKKVKKVSESEETEETDESEESEEEKSEKEAEEKEESKKEETESEEEITKKKIKKSKKIKSKSSKKSKKTEKSKTKEEKDKKVATKPEKEEEKEEMSLKTINISAEVEGTMLEELEEEETRKWERYMESEENLNSFLMKTRVLERCINLQYDPFVDYSVDHTQNNYTEDLILEKTYFVDFICNSRPVTSLEWFPDHPELFLATYGRKFSPMSHTKTPSKSKNLFFPQKNLSGPGTQASENDGFALLWSMYLIDRPELTFHNDNSPITAGKICPFDTNLIILGTEKGEIIIWDKRTKLGEAPVMISPVCSKTHTYPIVGLEIVGTQKNFNIMSLSAEGKVCTWNLEKFPQPLAGNQIRVGLDNVDPAGQVACAFCFPDQEEFFVGCLSGLVSAYSFEEITYNDRISSSASNSSSNPSSMSNSSSISNSSSNSSSTRMNNDENLGRDTKSKGFGMIGGQEKKSNHGHFGPVTGMDYNRFTVKDNVTVLTSGVDWTVRMWERERKNEPRFVFEDFSDYVYDVKWSPKTSTLFATGDGSGELQVWDTNYSIEKALQKNLDAKEPLNKLSWHPDGQRIIAGTGTSGKVHSYKLKQEIAMSEMKKEIEK